TNILQPTVLRLAGAALYSPYSLNQVTYSPSYSNRIRSGQLLADDESSTTLTVNTRSFVGSVIVTVPPRGRASSASSDTSCAQSENPPGVSVTSSRWSFAAIRSLPLLGGHRQRHRHRSDIHLLPHVDVGVI